MRLVWAERKCAHGDSEPIWNEQFGAGQVSSECEWRERPLNGLNAGCAKDISLQSHVP